MSVSKLEHLANEIMYTIFDYLDGFHLIFAFCGLNSRFTSLINHMLLHINTRYCRKADFNYLFDSIFPFTTNVFSLTISNTNHLGPIEIFINRYLDLILHNKLNYLKLIDIDQEALNIFLKTVFPKLTQLVSLNITNSMTEFRYNSPPEIMNVSLPAFKYLSLSIKQYEYYPIAPFFNEHMLMHQMESILSTVTHLSLEYSPRDITRLIDIFDKLNKIEYFQITLDIDDEIACAIGGPFIFNSQLIRDHGQHLRSFIIQIGYHILFTEIASLLTHFPQLQILSLATQEHTRHIQFYDGQQWEQLIQTSLPRLTSLRLYIFVDYLSSNPILHDIINRFRTSFWLNEKKWYIVGDQFSNCSLQIYTIPCPKKSIIILNNTSLAWDTTLPSINLSTFDCITRLKLYITKVESNPILLPYFNNVKSIKISPWSSVNETAKIGVAGDSAGGMIASSVARTVKNVDFQILIYATLDVIRETPSYNEFTHQMYNATPELMDWFTKHAFETSQDLKDPRISALYNTSLQDVPPCLFIVAELDALRDGNLGSEKNNIFL
ncbi:unnamed protein product [Adineta steineri]|uniref:Alpha/beta hydrolase fold-3 domain-containing protein n=2 Tax=Adineta steineri TaxID=433720 RepID=A0A813MJR2_9BILA|nr:unnamed protein product [Adineta steineri]